jgi:DNA-binding response OmpR family regulator
MMASWGADSSRPGSADGGTSMKQRILVVEDDASLARILRDNLIFEGFEVLCAADGASALKIAGEFHSDLVLLDVTLPDANGFDLWGPLRRRGPSPVLFLTAHTQKADKLRGLNLGADDYVTKPFDLEELLARVHVVLRRARAGGECITLGSVVIDFQTKRATKNGRTLHLAYREFDLLRFLARRRDRVVYRDELLREVWGYPVSPMTRSVDNAVSRLRKKIEPQPHRPRYIHTVHGDGYCLTSTEAADGPRVDSV